VVIDLFGHDFERLQPLVFLEDAVYVKTRRPAGPATLISALGVVHPLRALCSGRTLAEHRVRHNQGALMQVLAAELARHEALGSPLVYFLALAAAVHGRDWGEEPRATDVDSAALLAEALGELRGVIAHLPDPRLPLPALLVLGRVWHLVPASAPAVAGRVHVRWRETVLGLSGEYDLLRDLESAWWDCACQYLTAEVERHARSLCERSTVQASALASAQAHLERDGVLQVGDLLLIQGQPPLLGHVVPPHYNTALGRATGRDLALVAALTFPPQIGSLQVYGRAPSGTWHAVTLPHGLCLGKSPRGTIANQPGLALAAYLRWAAARVAVNGRFNQYDAR
jgi:hypothetical protein